MLKQNQSSSLVDIQGTARESYEECLTVLECLGNEVRLTLTLVMVLLDLAPFHLLSIQNHLKLL